MTCHNDCRLSGGNLADDKEGKTLRDNGCHVGLMEGINQMRNLRMDAMLSIGTRRRS